MGSGSQGRLIFRILAGALALLMGCFGAVLLIAAALATFDPWYGWILVAFGPLFFAWVFGAYALGFRGPYNWGAASGRR